MGIPLRVLFVEDSEDDTQLMIREIRRGDYDVEWERIETRAAMQAALTSRSWDLIISDHTMPAFSSMQALELLKSSGRDFPFIIISGSIGEAAAVAALKAGASDFMTKGNLARLIPAIQRELREAKARRERRLALEALSDSESRYRSLFESNPHPMWVYDLETLHFLAVNDAAVEHYGYSCDEFLSMTIQEIRPADDLPALMANLMEIQQDFQTPTAWRHRKKDGTLIDVEISSHSVAWAGRPGRLVIANDVTERKKAELRIQHLTRLYATLSQVNNTIVRVRERSELFQTICNVAVEYGKFGLAWIGLVNLETGQVTPMAVRGAAQIHFPFQKININEAPFKHGIIASATKSRQIAYSKDIQTDPNMQHWRAVALAGGFHSAAVVPFWLKGELFGLLNLFATDVDFFTDEEQHNLLEEMGQDISFALDTMEVETRRKHAEEALREKERLLSEAQRIGHIGSWSYDIANDSLQYSDEMYRLFDVAPQEFQHNSEAFLGLIYSSDRHMVAKWMEDIRAGRQVNELEFLIFRKNSELRYISCRGAVEFDMTGKPARFIGTAQDVTERKSAEIQIRQQIERLTALRKIDQAISSSFDLRVTLDVVISQVVSQLQVDAAEILLVEPYEQTLSYAAGKGFHTNAIESARLRIADCRAVRERRSIQIETLENMPDARLRTPLGASERFVCYFGVPLIVKGKVKGLLEIFHRVPLHPYPEWLDFLNTFAGQAAIAVENAQLFENLEQSIVELSQAYDATIEGWSRALDLRDKETEGHTRRVTEMTLDLARTFGLPEEQFLHIRWGALLHDIGKMGVPDNILLKPDELTEDEWIRMRHHPQYAYDLLKPITFLASALDIPYCHHEKWDGTGYPRGLKGKEIPLVARLFAVVDVWDALRSDRPYRLAWPKEKVIEYIQTYSGTHFDPNAVKHFLEMMNK